MTRVISIAKLRAPLGGQQIELQQVDFDAEGSPPLGGPQKDQPLSVSGAQRLGVPMSLLRTRIREGSRFTVFDIDPLTARAWGEALLQWSSEQTPK